MLCKFKNNVNSSMRTEYIYLIKNENVLENQKINGEEKNYDVTVPQAARTKDIWKEFIWEKETKKEKYEMINVIVYDLNDLTYLVV